MQKIKDNYDLFVDEEFRRHQELARLPICEICEEPIQQDSAVCINGDWYCDDCLQECRRYDIGLED